LETNESRWQRVVFPFLQKVGIQSMNGSSMGYWLHGDMANTILLWKIPTIPGKSWNLPFRTLIRGRYLWMEATGTTGFG
jgi:hypothetical protein